MNYPIVVLCALVSITAALPAPLNSRIVGGQDAVLGQFPYQISLRADGSHNCGGTIINNRWIVTAAHCLEGWPINRLTIAVGTIRLDDPEARVYQIESAEYHNDWDSLDLVNDVGVIRVTEDIELGTNVQTLPLNTEDIGAGVSLTLSGWGRISFPGDLPETLQWIELKSLSHEDCQQRHWREIFDSEICTLTKAGEGACHGDSGGPLVINGKLAGIVSWGSPCAQGKPDVFTRVSSFIDWIQQRVN